VSDEDDVRGWLRDTRPPPAPGRKPPERDAEISAADVARGREMNEVEACQ
jgi:hypothetical protein